MSFVEKILTAIIGHDLDKTINRLFGIWIGLGVVAILLGIGGIITAVHFIIKHW
jgi:hypothetical protein